MIDWYSLLFLAFCLLLTVIHYIGEHSSESVLHFYPEKIGLSKGTNFLLIRFVTGEVLLFSCYASVQYGAVSGFVIGAAGVFSIYWLKKIMMYVTIQKNPQESMMHIFADLMTSRAFSFMYIWIVLFYVNRLVLAAALSSFLFRHVFHLPNYALFLLLLYVYVFAVLAGTRGIQKIGTIQLYLIYIAVCIVPLSYYLASGIMKNYSVLVDKFPSFLQANSTQLVSLFFAVLEVMMGQLIVDEYMWRIGLAMKKERMNMIFHVAAFCWMAVPLAVTALFIPFAVQLGEGRSIAGMLHNLFKAPSAFFVFCLTVAFLASFSSSIAISLQSLLRLMEMQAVSRFNRKVLDQSKYCIGFCIVIIVFWVHHCFSMKQVMLFFVMLASSFYGLLALFYLQRKVRLAMLIPIVVFFFINWQWMMSRGEVMIVVTNGMECFFSLFIYRIIQNIKKL
ncbi:hypothetical protein ABET52_16025 [Saccharococcus caldoxylosilyticus]|jgi:hypothetical protein|uniref:Uncharacterized protein n=1 Tax=Saccharococcus caldoxylosilyticus TaxID=81408 RepID=A0A150LC22_9BACL|nr:hypothetical protein [Parageobacillus caldoxylosilyticus]KYD09824.1 hypothetical protein B4119_2672 [Parageobacillus caldoxylosilyticus]QXJ39772.1 hypothetical protein BV455_03138 [Parageobacillus caldoxylosilyticus]